MSQQGKVYREQGGDTLTVASGGTITVESGGAIALSAASGLTVLGTEFSNAAVRAYSRAATAGEATANAVVIDTGLTVVTGQVVQILRSGVDVTGDAVISVSGSEITVGDGASTYAVTAGDVINCIAFGY